MLKLILFEHVRIYVFIGSLLLSMGISYNAIQAQSERLGIVIKALFLLVLFIQFSHPTYAEENSPEDIQVNNVDFVFMYMFRANAPVFITNSSYSNFKMYTTPIFRWNETYKRAIISNFKDLDAKGKIRLYDQPDDIIGFEYKDRPYRIFIQPNYISVHQRINSNISRENYSKIYDEMRSFVYNNITTWQSCIRFFPNIPECPVASKRGKYQDATWTFYVHIEGFSPEINENNLEKFKNFHPFYYLDYVKTEKIYGNKYLFYYADPSDRENILIEFEPGGSLSRLNLLYYMELTEIIFAKAEQQKLEVKAEIVSTQKQINDLKNRIYTATDKKDIEHIKENLSNIDIENSSALKTLNELENLEELEQTIIDKKDDIFQRVYYEKIRRHKDTLSRDIEGSHSKIVELKSDREEARRLAEDKINALIQQEQNEENIRSTRILSILAIIVSIFAIYITHFRGPIIDLFFDYDDHKSETLILPITRDDEQHFVIKKLITGAFVNKGNRSGGVIMIDPNSATVSPTFDFQPPVELLTVVPSTFADITLTPGQIVPIKFAVGTTTTGNRVHKKEALELLTKAPNLTLKIQYKATTEKGFKLQEKKIKLKLIKDDKKHAAE